MIQPTLFPVAGACQVFPFTRLNTLQHLHICYEFVIPHKGRIRASLGGTDYLIQPGELLVLFPGVVHQLSCDGPTEGTIMVFTDRMLTQEDTALANLRPSSPVISLSEVDHDVEYCLRRLIRLGTPSPEAEPLAQAYISLIFLHLLPCLALSEASAQTTGNLLYRAMQYMTVNLAQPLTIRATAHALGVNSYYLSHVLNGKLNMSFRSYLNALRIDRARRYLRTTNRPIEEIAAACGFANLRTFDRVFAALCDCTPREFRKTAAALREQQLSEDSAP